jgi:hypothetical protein
MPNKGNEKTHRDMADSDDQQKCAEDSFVSFHQPAFP